MDYTLFLFDLDDTLLDFRASERLSFARTLASLGIEADTGPLYATYQQCNRALWDALEQGRIDQAFLKVERFRQLFLRHAIEADPARAAHTYLEWLPQTVVLTDGARAACDKPDVRFFEFAAAMAPDVGRARTVIIGDRLEADILGGNRFGIDSCWFNPQRAALSGEAVPTFQVAHLSELPGLLGRR